MNLNRPILCLLASLVFHQAVAQHTILIRNINLVDVEKGIIRPHAAVLIRDSTITAISYTAAVPSADTVIDGAGRYLIPGLWDMHTHIWNDELFFPLLVANGVTGIRGMFENIQIADGWKKKMAEGKIDGPEMRLAGPIVDGPKPIWPGSVAVKDPVDGRRAVDSLKNILHTDFIKVYSRLPRDSYFAIADEAKKIGIPFAGHVPYVISVTEAAKAGQKSQEHLYGFLEAASDSADYLLKVQQGIIKDSVMQNDRAYRRRFLFRTFNAARLQSILREIKQYDTWICPTLTVDHAIANLDDTSLLNDPRAQYIGRFIRGSWDARKDFRFKSLTPEIYLTLKKEFEFSLQIVKAMQDAGIPLLAGTDFPNPFCYPGFSLHEEMQWMVKAGLTPSQALQTATINPARYFRIEQQSGSVAVGKMASLVILDADPLSDIGNTQKISTVILRGKVFDRPALDALLARAKKVAGPL